MVLTDVATTTIFWFSIYGVLLQPPGNVTEPTVSGGDAALCYFDHLSSLGRIDVLRSHMRPIVTDRVAWSVGLFVGLSH